MAVEDPPQVLKFNVSDGQVVETYDLDIPASLDDNRGVESIVYLPASRRPAIQALVNDKDVPESSSGYFFAGIQSSGTVYIYPNPPLGEPLASFTWRRPRHAKAGKVDLAEMTVWNNWLYASFDRYKTIARVNLVSTFDEGDGEEAPANVHVLEYDDGWEDGEMDGVHGLRWEYYKVPRRGIEALAFAPAAHVPSGEWHPPAEAILFTGLDWKKRRGLWQYNC